MGMGKIPIELVHQPHRVQWGQRFIVTGLMWVARPRCRPWDSRACTSSTVSACTGAFRESQPRLKRRRPTLNVPFAERGLQPLQ